MDFGPENNPQRQPTQRNSRASSGNGLLLAPFRQFFATSPVPCPYIPARSERKLIVELTGPAASEFYDELSRAGFRRSQGFAYRPACPQCTACVPVRIAVDRFNHTRSTRRIRNINRDLSGSLTPARATPEQFRLFSNYQRLRHSDSDIDGVPEQDGFVAPGGVCGRHLPQSQCCGANDKIVDRDAPTLASPARGGARGGG